ncbi:MAG: WbqC family protein [Anaerolineaceae bacterium]
MKVVILQPSYIPWRGYFHQIAKSDLFIFYDDVQYDKRGWRNRNKIKTPQGPAWLSIPVFNKGAQTEHLPINTIQIVWDRPWNREHWNSIQLAYRKAPYFEQIADVLEPFYSARPDFLADFTIGQTIALARQLGITHTRFLRSSEIEGVEGAKTDRLLSILKKVGATHYISGPSARDYIENEKFQQAGISLEFMEYDYPEYPQLYPPFEAQVSIIDLMCMTGTDAIKYILSDGETLP